MKGHPSRLTRERRLTAAALRFLEANEAVRDARDAFGRGTAECSRAVEGRKAARRSVLYHAAALRDPERNTR